MSDWKKRVSTEVPPCPLCGSQPAYSRAVGDFLSFTHDCDCPYLDTTVSVYEVWRQGIQRRYRNALALLEKLPGQYREAALLSYGEGLDLTAEQVVPFESLMSLERGHSALIYGEPGAGKTTLMLQAMQHFMHRDGLDGEFFGEAEVLRKTKDSFSGESVRPNLEHADVVGFDDVGKSSAITPFYLELFYSLLENRVSTHRTLILTSNQSPLELVSRLTSVRGADQHTVSAIISRLRKFRFIHWRGPDLREWDPSSTVLEGELLFPGEVPQ